MQAELAEVTDERDAFKQQSESLQGSLERLQASQTAVEAKVRAFACPIQCTLTRDACSWVSC